MDEGGLSTTLSAGTTLSILVDQGVCEIEKAIGAGKNELRWYCR
jgi:hypothetical protein